jgi:hypothetical protein
LTLRPDAGFSAPSPRVALGRGLGLAALASLNHVAAAAREIGVKACLVVIDVD